MRTVSSANVRDGSVVLSWMLGVWSSLNSRGAILSINNVGDMVSPWHTPHSNATGCVSEVVVLNLV